MGGIGRRAFLGTGAAALLSHALPALGQDAPRRVKGVIWLWMGGGMSQIDTFDPKPGSPYAGQLRAIDSTVAGVQVCELLPGCAAAMKHLSLIRTVCTHEGDHARGTFLMHTGHLQDGGYGIPSIGTILAQELGNPESPLPKHVAIDPPRIPLGSPFGLDCLPVSLRSANDPIPNIRRSVEQSRDRDRLALLGEQNKDWNALRQQEEVLRLAAADDAAEDLMNTPELKVFNYLEEPAELRAAYGDRFGLNLLLARRLLQRGCAFVEVGMGGWDIHSDMPGNMKRRLPTLDAGLSTLVRDLVEKKMLSDVVVVLATEFGRTPSINAGMGRDRQADGFSVVLAGGALRGGKVYGDTGADGSHPTPPVSAPDLLATILRACGVNERTKYRSAGRMFRYVDGGEPIADLF